MHWNLTPRASISQTKEERSRLYQDAIRKYNLSVVLDPRDSKAYYGRGVAERKSGQLNEDNSLLRVRRRSTTLKLETTCFRVQTSTRYAPRDSLHVPLVARLPVRATRPPHPITTTSFVPLLPSLPPPRRALVFIRRR